jgi:diguanylate cyclase (GGDEF)-like protein
MTQRLCPRSLCLVPAIACLPNTRFRRARLLALLLLPGTPATAEFLSLQRYGLDQGLSQTSVTALAEDDLGLLWVGTQDGLNRFDGQRFSVLRRQLDDRDGLASSSVDSLAMDAEGRLWIGTNDAGVEVRDLRSGARRRLGSAAGLSHPTVSRLLPDGRGGAWLGTPRGLDHVDAGRDAVHRLHAGDAIVALLAEGAGGFALGQRCGVLRFDAAGVQALPRVPHLPAGARCIGLVAGAETLWLGTRDHGLLAIDRDGRLRRSIAPDALLTDPAPLNSLFRRRDGSLLLGFADGRVVALDLAGAAAVVRTDPPLQSAVTGFFEHSSGVLFIGTHSAGLFRTRALSAALRLEHVDRDALAAWPNRNIYALWRQGEDWLVGTEAGLLRRHAGGGWETVPALGARAVRRIYPLPAGGWLLGTHDGLWQLDAGFAARRIEGDYDPRIADLLADGDDLLVATRDGLYRLRDGGPTQQDVPAPLQRGFLTALLRDHDGSVWVGSNEQGAWRIAPDGSVDRHHRGRGTLVHDSVWALHADAEAVWLGTYSGGLQRLPRDGSPGRVYSERQGLSNDVVYRIEPDPAGRLWLSTNRGLSVLDPDRGTVQVLLRSDGLRNQEYNAGASFRDERGLLYFGGVDGIDVIDPAALPARSAPATPLAGTLAVLGRRGVAAGAGALLSHSLRYREQLQLDWRDSVFALDMVALDFGAPDSARLRYRLPGIADDWVYPAAPRAELLLSYLPPGAYTLELAAAGRDGRYGPARQVAITLPPPPWRQPWAFAGYLGLAAAALWLLWRRLRRQGAAKQAQIDLLNRMVAERTAALEQANRLLRHSNAQLDLAGRTDPLTRVSNRRDLLEWLPQARSDGRGLLFCMVDIDDFKRINDTHGHQAGDEVLVRFAERLRGLCRDRDMLMRWGGEEFLLALRETRPEDAPALLERLRHRIADTPIPLDNGLRIPITCSAGFARWPFSERWAELGDWEQSVALADRALYRAKRAGKNRWVGWVEGTQLTEASLQQLLEGTPPEQLPDGCCRQVAGPDATLDLPR